MVRGIRPKRGFTAARIITVLWPLVIVTLFLRVMTMLFIGVAFGNSMLIVAIASFASVGINGNKRFPVSAGELYGFVLLVFRICQTVNLFRHFGSLCLNIGFGSLMHAVALSRKVSLYRIEWINRAFRHLLPSP